MKSRSNKGPKRTIVALRKYPWIRVDAEHKRPVSKDVELHSFTAEELLRAGSGLSAKGPK